MPWQPNSERSEYDAESAIHGEELFRTNILKRNGWLKGFAWFGSPASDHSAKLAAAVGLLTNQENFPFTEVEHVMMSYNEAEIVKNAKGKVSMGVWSSAWAMLTYNTSTMPAICVNGAIHIDSGRILQAFAETYPDPELSDIDRAEVARWVDFNLLRVLAKQFANELANCRSRH